MELISRETALLSGLKRYFTGVPCKHGHVCERYTKGKECVHCVIDASERRRLKDPVKYAHSVRESNRKWSSKNELEYRRQDRKSNPEKYREKSRRWRANNPEKAKEINAKQYQKNREKILARKKQYWQENPDIRQSARASYNARKRSAEGSFTSADVLRMKESQSMMCNGCRCDMNETGYHIDHIVPLSRGGTNWPSNLQLLCPTCNHKKYNKHPEEWLKAQT